MSSSASPSVFTPAMSISSASSPAVEDPSSIEDELDHKSENLDPVFQDRFSRLNSLLTKSLTYTSLLKDNIERDRRAHTDQNVNEDANSEEDEVLQRTKGRKKRGGVAAAARPQKRPRVEQPTNEPQFQQPALVTGTRLRDYQLDGVCWLARLWENGVNGILADEMGLGKTLQVISFVAYLMERDVRSPTLIVCPLSVLHNWQTEFEKFAPNIPVCMYYGTPDHRSELRRTVLLPRPVDDDVKPSEEPSEPAVPKRSRGRPKSGRKVQRKKSTARPNTNAQRRTAPEPSELDTDGDPLANETTAELFQRVQGMFPVVLTTYEIIIRDQQALGNHRWGYIIVDEGHRLKNLDCKLMQQIKRYHSANRIILTGTPLHNNLAELWSLLNFILPDIFDDLEIFQEWFNLDLLQETLGESHSMQVVTKLHGILSPFLMRRLKSDVEPNLPPKKEYILYARLTPKQRELYKAVLDGALRQWLIGHKHKGQVAVTETKEGSELGKRRRKKVNYAIESDDDEYVAKLEAGEGHSHEMTTPSEDIASARVTISRDAVKQVNRMHLRNTTMQLRKVCSHPFAFDWPIDPITRDFVVNDDLVDASGKMMLLDRLLDELFARGHKGASLRDDVQWSSTCPTVILFTQFVTMLDLLEDWAVLFKKWAICRIDGSTSPEQRREQMNRFNTSGNGPADPRLFLLSTRAGGLGINLVSADTVIFYDQDWNPQMDLQAQDRAHRIGQTKPVLIFRLVTAHTIETKIMQRAGEKRKLEALVIAKGKFKNPTKQSEVNAADLASSLLRLESERIEVIEKGDSVISDATLHKLLDRSPEVFLQRRKGWNEQADGGVAFEVFETPTDGGNDMLATLLGEDE